MNPVDDMTLKARALPRAVEPDRDLWPEIAARLNAPEDELPAKRAAARGPAWSGAAALAASLIVAATVGFWLARGLDAPSSDHASADPVPAAEPDPGSPIRTASLAMDDEVRRTRFALAEDIERRLTTLTPATRTVVLDNLRVINKALNEIDAALAASPRSDLDARLLMAMYADQVMLLNAMNNALQTSSAEIAL